MIAGGRFVMSIYRKPSRKDWLKNLIYITAYVLVIGFSSFHLLLSYWYVWITLVIGGLLLLVSWHTKAAIYHCSRCGHYFKTSVFTNLMSPHGIDRGGGWKYLKCPNCLTRSRMKILLKSSDKTQSS